jgi:hypothetical protein
MKSVNMLKDGRLGTMKRKGVTDLELAAKTVGPQAVPNELFNEEESEETLKYRRMRYMNVLFPK